MTIEFSFFFHLSIKRVLLQNSFFSKIALLFPIVGPFVNPTKTILTQLNIYLFANNPEILFSALFSFFLTD